MIKKNKKSLKYSNKASLKTLDSMDSKQIHIKSSTELIVSKTNPKEIGFLDLFKFSSKSDKCMMLCASIFSVTEGILYSIFPLFFGEFTDTLYTKQSPEELKTQTLQQSLILLGVGVLIFVISVLGTFLWSKVGNNQMINLREQYFYNVICKSAK